MRPPIRRPVLPSKAYFNKSAVTNHVAGADRVVDRGQAGREASRNRSISAHRGAAGGVRPGRHLWSSGRSHGGRSVSHGVAGSGS